LFKLHAGRVIKGQLYRYGAAGKFRFKTAWACRGFELLLLLGVLNKG
jgi:hypothetical protein